MMKISKKTLKNSFSMPVFGLGTWEMGGRGERNVTNDDAADILAIQNAIRAGITHVDTAQSYAAGHAETLVGQALGSFERKNLLLVTKVQPVNQYHDDVISALEESLQRLKTSYVDLYMLHAPNHEVPFKETMRAMEELVEAGKIKHIGVSNFSVETLQVAQSHCKYPIVANQVHYNLQCREPAKKGLLEYCQKNDVMLIAYRPIEKGMLLEADGPIVADLCKKYKKTCAQIAINWLIHQKNVVTMSKMRSPDHLQENLAALDWQMEEKDWKRLEEEFPNQVDISAVCSLS